MSKKLGIILISGTVLIIALGAMIWWLFASGRLTYISQSSKQKLYTTVCDSGVVDRYNTYTLYNARNGSSQPSIDQKSLDSLMAEIKAMPNHETDPTCQSIIFLASVRADDYKTAVSAYESISALNKNDVYPSNNIRGNQPLFMYQGYLDSLSGSPRASSLGNEYVVD